MIGPTSPARQETFAGINRVEIGLMKSLSYPPIRGEFGMGQMLVRLQMIPYARELVAQHRVTETTHDLGNQQVGDLHVWPLVAMAVVTFDELAEQRVRGVAARSRGTYSKG